MHMQNSGMLRISLHAYKIPPAGTRDPYAYASDETVGLCATNPIIGKLLIDLFTNWRLLYHSEIITNSDR